MRESRQSPPRRPSRRAPAADRHLIAPEHVHLGGAPVQTLKRVSTIQALVDTLRERVLDGDHAPGEPLREVELSRKFGVGRHSVRAALQALTREGLLEHSPNRGVFVPVYDDADIADIFRLRVALESEAASLLTENHFVPAAALAALDKMAHLGEQASWSSVVRADLDFHRALVEATASERLIRVYTALQAEIGLSLMRQRPLYRGPRGVVNEHRALLRVLEKGTARQMAAAMRQHVENALGSVQKMERELAAKAARG
jgi:DNA-binding GntR family transcriptional regulator